ncbi:response regulator [Roseateles sp. DAIF2]|nr:response regulator [Roseateles sp. DAIF2]
MTVTASEAASPTILFVDDEPSILSALRRLFRPEGYRVLLAESATAALALLETEPVDLVVSDMRMPVMDGAQFLEQVRRRWPELVRILLTGYADIGATIAAINRGEIHRYIAKPWEDQDLLLVVREGLTRRRLEQENRHLQRLTAAQNEQLQSANAELERRVLARTQEIAQINGFLEQAYAELEQQFLLSLDVFAGLLELREGGSAGHSRRVALLARRTAERLGLDPPTCQDVFSAGLLHEIGKIGLPDALLRKPVSTMNGEEQARYRQHNLNAEAALLALPRLQRAARFVRWQDERIDGRGLPDGLAGDELPRAAQALSLAVHYHGLLSGRLAAKRLGPTEAAAVIKQGAGLRYEPAVVAAFQQVLAEAPPEVESDWLIAAAELRPGMVLARDLLSPQGTLLLAAGFCFDAHKVRQIHEFIERGGVRLNLHVRRPPPTAATEAAHESAHPAR